MRWLLLLLLATVVWFLAHAAPAARKLLENARRGSPPEARVSFSLMPGMVVMPVASISVAAVADHFAPTRGFQIVVLLHLAWGTYLIAYIALNIVRARRTLRRA